jgi:uncharacterized phage-associated protein
MSRLTFHKLVLKFRKEDKKELPVATVFDVAKYILQKQGPVTTMKLQKLVYYCQAWSVAWDGEPLFNECTQAWASGPVVPELYQAHKGMYQIDAPNLPKGDAGKLNPTQIETIDAVLKSYGNKSAQWLSDLTHMEEPWLNAREGIPPGCNCEQEIKLDCMGEYYSGMPPDSETV